MTAFVDSSVQSAEKRSYPEIPPRVEYSLTEFGRKFWRTLDALMHWRPTERRPRGTDDSSAQNGVAADGAVARSGTRLTGIADEPGPT
jgi:hypothetical protein